MQISNLLSIVNKQSEQAFLSIQDIFRFWICADLIHEQCSNQPFEVQLPPQENSTNSHIDQFKDNPNLLSILNM